MSGHPSQEEDFDLYALGALDGEERRTFEAHLAVCPDCARKLAEAGGRLALLALAAPPQASPPGVRERLLRHIREYPSALPKKELGMAPPSFERWWASVWAPAAVALAIAAILLWVTNNRLSRELRDLRLAAAQQAEQTKRTRALVELLSAHDTVEIMLAPAACMPQAQGRILYNARQGLLIYTGNLPALPSDKTYQLWLVPAAGNPISAGVFNPDATGQAVVVLPPLPGGISAKVFAVTIEPAGGRPQPTGNKVLIGAVS